MTSQSFIASTKASVETVLRTKLDIWLRNFSFRLSLKLVLPLLLTLG